MRAIALHQYLPIDNPEALIDVELPTPEPGPGELRVRVEAISVNPVDVKVRAPKPKVETAPRVLGWDAAGVVDAVGPGVKLFQPGDAVYYAGSIARPGTNSEFHLVDERIVGHKPRSLSFAQAAALPLTSITAWELLFERLGISRSTAPTQDTLLIVGGAGGVGSIAIQLARKLAGVTVVATASRPESTSWCESMGAHHVVDHRQSLVPQLQKLAPQGVRYIASLTATDSHFPELVEVAAPFGHLGLIDDPSKPLDIGSMKRKSLSLHWELMFTRPLYDAADPLEQHRILNRVAELVDAGTLKTTMTQDFGPITAANLRRAHAAIESGRTVGKIVLGGYPTSHE
ncbi:zinc-binding alcohol dehydrogenase family protein [Comamonas sp. JC664]|uniref:zinc-binding alcohol dehydrogenase family protein n=1 Tax=Comamonas sp. JC664 TaxID=2801917 RepID=UPI0017486429|nr:zinc-binding alcohol dehydrogenase family protein [Comamonas sp. JC664]MBL0695644.1 zinc-binding alcohol dehydrogenase family protein [Comamonas sp. JC664]GHG62708.1 oxidoreductase [Comamonas sp. KCTC 72670]